MCWFICHVTMVTECVVLFTFTVLFGIWMKLVLYLQYIFRGYIYVQILPIHCSMVGCRRLLHHYIHANVYLIFFVLCAFGVFGYLRYGNDVPQLVVLAITQHTPLSLLVDATLIISVLFTFPLQCFPVIEILEGYILTPGIWVSSVPTSYRSLMCCVSCSLQWVMDISQNKTASTRLFPSLLWCLWLGNKRSILPVKPVPLILKA